MASIESLIQGREIFTAKLLPNWLRPELLLRWDMLIVKKDSEEDRKVVLCGDSACPYMSLCVQIGIDSYIDSFVELLVTVVIRAQAVKLRRPYCFLRNYYSSK